MKRGCGIINGYVSNKKTVWNFIRRLISKIYKDDVFALSAQLAYSLLLSFIPFLILLMIIIGLSNLNSDEVLMYLSGLLPSNVYNLIDSTVVEVVNGRQGNLLVPTIMMAMWTSSSGFSAINIGLDKAYGVRDTRNYFKRMLYGLISTIALVLIIVLSLLMIVFSGFIRQFLLDLLPFDDVIIFAWNIVRLAGVMITMVLTFTLIYFFIPAKKVRWRECFPGAILSALGWIGISYLFSFYVENFSNYSRLYGSLGAVFALMTWLYITSFILILGGVVNSTMIE
ncbi:MAG: YihY/virulence factor BrkB family protein [Clostridiaceae bacterium]